METSLNELGIDIGAHMLYFLASIVLVIVFIAIYTAITPYREITLIRSGNTAAAISLGGAVVGYSVPLTYAVAQSGNIVEMLTWSLVALVAQLVAYLITRLLLPHLPADVNEGKLAPAIFLAAISIAIGLLNAAAMTD
jgi:putative membrane protein